MRVSLTVGVAEQSQNTQSGNGPGGGPPGGGAPGGRPPRQEAAPAPVHHGPGPDPFGNDYAAASCLASAQMTSTSTAISTSAQNG